MDSLRNAKIMSLKKAFIAGIFALTLYHTSASTNIDAVRMFVLGFVAPGNQTLPPTSWLESEVVDPCPDWTLHPPLNGLGPVR